MARESISIQSIDYDGLQATYTAAIADGHYFRSTGDQFIHVKNDGGSAVVVTVPSTKTIKGLGLDDIQVSVPAGEERFINLGNPGLNVQTDGTVYINTDQQSSVSYAVLKRSD